MRTGFTYDLQLTVIKFFVIMANSDNKFVSRRLQIPLENVINVLFINESLHPSLTEFTFMETKKCLPRKLFSFNHNRGGGKEKKKSGLNVKSFVMFLSF
jgi:hypothetical protein